jgi:3',5'-cyclic AMP phosphodiesterase CpdA
MAQVFTLAVVSDLHIDRDRKPASWDLAQAAFAAISGVRADHVSPPPSLRSNIADIAGGQRTTRRFRSSSSPEPTTHECAQG